MIPPARFPQHCAQLTNPNIKPEARAELAAKVRDSMEHVHSHEYASFLLNFLPAFKVVLSDLTAPQQSDNIIQKTRAVILEILNRLPHNDVLRERILDVFNMAMQTLKNDNEDNAVTALHIIFDLHKNYRHHLGNQVQPFLDFVRRLYESFGNTVEALLTIKSPEPPAAQPEPKKLSPSTQSFKVITECPLLVMFVFQLYPSLIQSNIQRLLPLMVRAIQYTIPAMIPATAKQVFHDFIASQVKTVSFLAYLFKQFPDVMKADELSIPRSVVKLMQTCPGDSVAIRKELLVATRHILTSRFRSGFFDQIDLLLDERVLVGTGKAGTSTLRPLAYSFLAELVHCVRLNLSIPQLEKIIFLFSANVHDPKFSYSLQTNSVRLLFNLIEGIAKVDPADPSQRAAARELLIRILETMVAKYITLGEQVPRLLETVEQLRQRPDPVTEGKRLVEVPIGDPLKEIVDFKTLLKTLTLGIKTVIWSAINITVPQPNPARTNSSASVPGNGQQRKTRQSMRNGLLEKECEIVSKLLCAGKKCFRLFSRHERANGGHDDERAAVKSTGKSETGGAGDRASNENTPKVGEVDLLSEYANNAKPERIVASSSQEEREVFEQFAQIFTVLDPPSFQDVFGLRISELFDYIVENPAAITIPQHFLANSSVSKYFADIMFNYLVCNMEFLDVPHQDANQRQAKEAKRASCLLKLFRILFASVNLFPTNEPVLRLHLHSIVKISLKHALNAEDPHAYLQMLRGLFKTITSGKHEVQFEMLYRDFMPLVGPIFSHLLALYNGPTRVVHKELIVELCLNIPARPSTIFPYLDQQIKPIVWAIQGGRENPMYGLRSLEFWVDMLQPGYLRILLDKVEPDLTRALHSHLRPPGNSYGPAALRVLGKLGSRSRSHTSLTLPLSLKSNIQARQQIRLEWHDGLELSLETDELIKFCADTLLDRRKMETTKVDRDQKVECWRFLFGCLCPMLGFQEETGAMEDGSLTAGNREHKYFPRLAKSDSKGHQDEPEHAENRNQTAKLQSGSDNATAMILGSLIASSGTEDLKDKPVSRQASREKSLTTEEAVQALCKYFAVLSVQQSAPTEDTKVNADHLSNARGGSSSFSVFVEALMYAASSEDRTHAAAGLHCLQNYVGEILSLCTDESSSSAAKRPMTSEKPVPPAVETDLAEDESVQNMKQSGLDHPSTQTGIDQGTCMVPADPARMEVDTGEANGGLCKGNEGAAISHRMETVLLYALGPTFDRLRHCCYQRTWTSKWAGCYGLQALFRGLPKSILMSSEFSDNLTRSFGALLFLSRDTKDRENDTLVSSNIELLREVIHLLVRKGSSDFASSNPSVSSKPGFPRVIYELLASDIIHKSANARRTAKFCFKEIAQALSMQDESEIVAKVKDRIFQALGERPLRQHLLDIQIGYLDAASYCMQLRRPLLCNEIFDSPLKEYVLIESMIIVDANHFDPTIDTEDGFRAKYHDNRYLDAKTSRLLQRLRLKVLEFLCNVSVHCHTFLQAPRHKREFGAMIACFFRSLQGRDEEMVQYAKHGLKHAIGKHPKPKDLLHDNFRPFLENLGDYKKLSLQYLQGLNRALELFSHWFNVRLGKQLLEHLQRWTEPEKIAPLKKMMAGGESKVAAAILDMFHLLPGAASGFMGEIVNMVLRLESVIALAAPGAAHLGLKNPMGASTSPYRAPLLKYCNQHAAVASEYFLARLDDDRMRQLFFVMIRAPNSEALRKDLMKTPKRLLSPTYFAADGKSAATLYAITLIDLLSRHDPAWLKEDPEIHLKLTTYWRLVLGAPELRHNNSGTLATVKAVKTVAEIFIRYCSRFPEEVNTLFDLLAVFSIRTTCDFTFVKDFLMSSVTGPSSQPNRRVVLTRVLALFHDSNQSQERKVHALQYIVTPMVTSHLKNVPRESKRASKSSTGAAKNPPSATDEKNVSHVHGSGPESSAVRNTGTASGKSSQAHSHSETGNAADEILDSVIIQRIMKDLFDQPDATLRDYDELLSAELLRLAAVLIQYLPKELGRYRQELIKFGWNHLKREDSIAKHWAFVNVSRFFEAYHAPGRIILQVYVALLRACQGDGKDLVQQALDILTPALPLRLEHKLADHKYPIWIRYTKKILLEEGHSVPNLIHIWHLIARHPDLFYVARAQFVPIMVNSLSRIGLNVATSNENRRLALDLVDLILQWERVRREKTKGAVGTAGETSPTQDDSKKRSRDQTVKQNDAATTEAAGEPNRREGTEPPSKTRKGEGAKPIPTSSSQNRASAGSLGRDADEFKPGIPMVDMILSFLTQVLFRPLDRRETPILTRRVGSLLTQALLLWPEATVRIQFIEKMLAPLSADTVQGNSASGAVGKAAATSSASDFNNVETKNNSKTESLKSDRAEQARVKRAAARQSALMSSLLLADILARHQGIVFIKRNINALRALVTPSVTGSSFQAASQFANLLQRVLSQSVSPEILSGDLASGDRKESVLGDTALPQNPTISRADGQKQAAESRTTERTAAGGNQEDLSWRADLIGDVKVAIDLCLKSSDATRNHCGLVVLRSVAEGAPGEILKFQESLTKTLHRMAKENISASQQTSAAGANTTFQGNGTGGSQRSSMTSERAGPSNATPFRGTVGNLSNNQNQDKNHSGEPQRNGKPSSGLKSGHQASQDMRPLVLCLNLLGRSISTLEPGQRKTLFHVLWALIDRCIQVEVLLEIVSIVGDWVFWKPDCIRSSQTSKEPLTVKEKVHFLLKMIVFERISGLGSRKLMDAYLRIILRIFGGEDSKYKRPELKTKLERAFMVGLKTMESPLRRKFFDIYDAAVDRSLTVRLSFIIGKQDWEHLSDTFWIKQATELLLSAVGKERRLQMKSDGTGFIAWCSASATRARLGHQSLLTLRSIIEDIRIGAVVEPMMALIHCDAELANMLWGMLFAKTWQKVNRTERSSLEKSLASLLTKEYHQVQVSWRRSNIQSLLEAVAHCEPLPLLRPDVVRHLGARWNAWHAALSYLEKRNTTLSLTLRDRAKAADEREENVVRAELEDIADAQLSIYSQLQERDFVAGLWKARARSKKTARALCLEQISLFSHAQDVYSSALSEQLTSSGSVYSSSRGAEPGRTEITFWEERWLDCARNLCQWEVLTEFSRTVVNSKLLHECLWRLPDWSALKELLIKNPVGDGPQLKIYHAYVQLQENKLEIADNFITQGYHKAQEKFCSLPETCDLDAYSSTLVQFQQLVELQESTRILSELNALSRHGNGSINVDQKVDSIRLILNTWRERLPSPHEHLAYWNDILTWRNHVHAVVVNVLDALKEAASAKVTAGQSSTSGGASRNGAVNSQAAQVQAAAAIAQALSQQVLVMGVNETAWNVHRFAKACRKQGYPEVALYVLQKMYPFGTMELTEYFVKTKETARSFMDGPKGLAKHVESGLNELNRCNMDHFNARQKAQLFTVKGKLCMALGRQDDAVESFSTALHTSADVGSAWLAWGKHCDIMQERARQSPSQFSTFASQNLVEKSGVELPSGLSPSLNAELAFRESAATCYIQAARFGSRKMRAFLPRVLHLLSVDVHTRARLKLTPKTKAAVRSEMDTKPNGADAGLRRGQAAAGSGARGDSPAVSGESAAQSAQGLMPHMQGVGKIVASSVSDVPPWIWLPWRSQLVSMLSGKEATIVELVLTRVAKLYPQALFFHLKAFMEERESLDKPRKLMFKEAMKLGRPIVPALRSAAPAQLSQAIRQTQVAKDAYHRIDERFRALKKEMENVEKAIASSVGTPEHATNLARKSRVKNEFVSSHGMLEKCAFTLQAASRRQRQIQENIAGLQSSLALKNELAAPGAKGTTDKPGAGQQSSGPAVSKTNSTSSRDTAKQTSSKETATSAENASRPATAFERADGIMTQLVRDHQRVHWEITRVAMELSHRMRPHAEEDLPCLLTKLLRECYDVPVTGDSSATGSTVRVIKGKLSEVAREYFAGAKGQTQGNGHEICRSVADLKDGFIRELISHEGSESCQDLEGVISGLRRWRGVFRRRIDSTLRKSYVEDQSRYLANVKESEVEVFGQYAGHDFSEPSIEKHVKICRFGSEFYVDTEAAYPSRGFEVLGSDGKKYGFAVVSGMSGKRFWCEERMTHLYRLMNGAVFEKDSESHRRRMRLTVPLLLCLGGKLHVVSRNGEESCMKYEIEKQLRTEGRCSEDLIESFRRLVGEQSKKEGMVGARDEKSWKVGALEEMGDKGMSDSWLLKSVCGRMENRTATFMFRKRFAESMGTTCMMSYILGTKVADAEEISFAWNSGVVRQKNLRMGMNGSGELGGEHAVPFRLTKNMVKVMGEMGVSGSFYGCLAASSHAMRKKDEMVKSLAELMMRDEVVGNMKGWRGEVEYEKVDMMARKGMEGVSQRLLKSDVGGQEQGESGQGESGEEDVVDYAQALVERASDVRNKAEMATSWEAWM